MSAKGKRMGGLGLRDFAGKDSAEQPTDSQPTETQAIETKPAPVEAAPIEQPTPSSDVKKPEKLVTVNIKITRSQHEWLNDTARTVRDNNDIPVPAGDRVYPQHLIQVAIELLKSSDIDWDNVRNVDELKQFLNL